MLPHVPYFGRAEACPSGKRLASSHGAEDDERFGAGGDGVGEGSIGGIVGEVLFAGEEADEGAALLRDVIANGSAQYRIAYLEGVEDRALGNRAGNVELHLALDFCQLLKVEWERDSDHAVQEVPIVKTQAPNKSQISMTKSSSPARVA
jgi:hypothetical protein